MPHPNCRYFGSVLFFGLTFPVIMLGMGLPFRHYAEVIIIPCMFTVVIPFVMASTKRQFQTYFATPYTDPTCGPSSADLDPVPVVGAISDTFILVCVHLPVHPRLRDVSTGSEMRRLDPVFLFFFFRQDGRAGTRR
jgi:hypothetical protein